MKINAQIKLKTEKKIKINAKYRNKIYLEYTSRRKWELNLALGKVLHVLYAINEQPNEQLESNNPLYLTNNAEP